MRHWAYNFFQAGPVCILSYRRSAIVRHRSSIAQVETITGNAAWCRYNKVARATSQLGQKQTLKPFHPMSALPPKADIDTENRETTRREIKPTCTTEICGGRRGFS